jgi:hypothetical protein
MKSINYGINIIFYDVVNYVHNNKRNSERMYFIK